MERNNILRMCPFKAPFWMKDLALVRLSVQPQVKTAGRALCTQRNRS